MRTTVTLDADVARLVDDAVHGTRRSRKQVINDALRKALGPSSPARAKPYGLSPHRSAIRPGIDLSGLNRLADHLEDEAIEASMRRSG